MLDHVLGRPSSKSRRLQVLAVLAFWSAYFARGDKNGPPGVRSLSRLLSRRLTAWQTVLLTLIYLYAARNFSNLVGLASPDPLANMYDATFFRATWLLTALDAGFWTAMKIRRRWLRDLASIVFSAFYLVAAERADEKVRKVRGNLTVEHLRVSWNKGTTPYLSALQSLVRPRLTRWPPRLVRIPRPPTSDYQGQPIMAWLYYDGPLEQLYNSGINRVVLDIPGGGFVAMDPRCNDDRLLSWAVQTGLPVLSLDYKKAPEHPFPYALNECYDVYATLINTRGRCIGLAARDPVRVVVTGDSAGGNLAAAMTLMLAESAPAALFPADNNNNDHSNGVDGQSRQQQQRPLPLPDGLVLVYPSLDVNIGSWMSDEQMALIQDRRSRATNRNVLRRKTIEYSEVAGTPLQSDNDSPTMAGALSQQNASDDSADEDEDALVERARTPQPAYSHVNMASYKGSKTPQRATTPAATERMPSLTPKPKPAADGQGGQGGQGDGIPPQTPTASYHPEALSTRLTTSSTISYFNDRVLTPEMMRAMIIMYVGPHNRPDFSQNYYLSPILAPDLLLAHFPKTYFLTGERDPLVDDTVIFAGRLRRVKAAYCASGGRRVEYRESDALCEDFDDREVAEVVLIPGVSHGFLQFPSAYPPAWKWFKRSAGWIEDAFRHADEMRTRNLSSLAQNSRVRRGRTTRKERDGGDYGFPAVPVLQQPPPPLAKATAESKAMRQQAEAAGGAQAVGEATARDVDTASRDVGHTQGRAESSGDESPLEMMRTTKVRGRTGTGSSGNDNGLPRTTGSPSSTGLGTAMATTSANAPPAAETTPEANRGHGGRSARAGKTKRGSQRKRQEDDKQLERLASSDDLLGRRMKGIVGGLSGVTEE